MTRRMLLAGLSAGRVVLAGEPVRASHESFSWLAGRWRGELSFGTIEEIWSPAADGAMMGMFRMINRGKPSLYEFMTLEQRGDGVVMKIRHFNGQFVAREEKNKAVEFALTGLAGGESTFFTDEGEAQVTLVYRRLGAEGLEVDFKKIASGGKAPAMKFPYKRAGFADSKG